MKEFLKKYAAVCLMFLIVAAVCLMFSCRKSGMFIDEIYPTASPTAATPPI
ncbi:MAG: hypothetical protein V8T45_07435 [Oscillospiraceae bacterium]